MEPNKAKLLLVDDEPLQLKVLKTMVDTLPYALEVETCTNGREAIDYLENPSNAPYPDIIITDYLMPLVNGLELLEHVRKDNKYKAVSVLMVSALDEPEIQETALELGVDDFLRRPLNRYELQARCNSFIHFPQHVKGTLEHAVFYEQRFAFLDTNTGTKNNDMLKAFKRYLAELLEYQPAYLPLLTDITEFITKQLNLDTYLCKQMSEAISLHDAGTGLVKNSTINTRSPYQAGHDLFQDLPEPFFQLAAEICMHKDERFDGNGLPGKLKDVNIPLAARIASISIFIASQCCHTDKTDTTENILAELEKQSGGQFDPELVQIISENTDVIIKKIHTALNNAT